MGRELPAFHVDNEPLPLRDKGPGATTASLQTCSSLLLGVSSRTGPTPEAAGGGASEEFWEAWVTSLFPIQEVSPLNDPMPCISLFEGDFLKNRP